MFSSGRTPAQLNGYVTAVISLAQLMNVGTAEQDNLAVTMQDLSSPARPEPVYQSPVAAIHNRLYASSLLSLGDRDYLIEVRPTQIFNLSNQIMMPGRVLWLGGLLSLMLSALLYTLISQRQRALQRAHGQLRNVLDAATEVAIIATDLDGLINMFNVGAEKMLGYPQEQILGKFHLMDLYQSAELEARASSLSRERGQPISAAQLMFLDAVQDGTHPSQEWTLQRSDGSTLVVDMLVTAVRDDQGLWTGYLAVCIDVTEHKRVNQALAEQGQLLKKLGSQVPGGIYQYHLATDGSARFRYASAGMCELFEVGEAQLLGVADAVMRRIEPAGPCPGQDLDSCQRKAPHCLERGVPGRAATQGAALAERGLHAGAAGRWQCVVARVCVRYHRPQARRAGVASAVSHRRIDRRL